MDYSHIIREALDEIERNILSDLTAAGLAGGAFISKYHFQRVFKRYTGFTVMDYIRRRRLTLAAGELAVRDSSDADTILDTALKYGYGSHETFTRAFKLMHGFTPAETREYGLFRPFGPQAGIMEDEPMKPVHFDEKLNREAERIKQRIGQSLETLAGEIELAAHSAVKRYADNGIPGGHMGVISDMLLGLREEALDIAGKISGLTAADPDEWRESGIVKRLEDIAFELNLLSFNAGLTISRMPPAVRTHIDGIPATLFPLAKAAAECASKPSEVFGLIYGSLVEQGTGELRSLIEGTGEALSGLESVAQLIRNTAEQTGAQPLNTLADEICGLRKPYPAILERLDAENTDILSPLTEDALSELAAELDNTRFLLGIRRFDARMELARITADARQYEKIPIAIEIVSDAFFGAGATLETVLGYIGRLKNIPEAGGHGERKAMDDIRFQSETLLYYLKSETAKYSTVGSAVEPDRLSVCRERLEAAIAMTLDNGASLGEVASALESAARSIVSVSESLELGSAFMYIGAETEKLANAVKEIGV